MIKIQHHQAVAALITLSLAWCAYAAAGDSGEKLAKVLAGEPDEVKARYEWRHPQETLTFFGIEPGMTVVEGLPGGGWYSRILIQYLGEEGSLIGANYTQSMYPLFGFFSDERIEELSTWETDWPVEAGEWDYENAAGVSAFRFGSMPESVNATADAVLMIRAFHNLNRFEGQGGYLTSALSDIHSVLKPGGTLGVVQHEGPEDNPDEWADGRSGYLKKKQLIKAIEAAGFEFVAESDVNENPKDQPTAEDIVWRLPPSLVTSREDADLRAELEAIGESNRMTLKFRKK